MGRIRIRWPETGNTVNPAGDPIFRDHLAAGRAAAVEEARQGAQEPPSRPAGPDPDPDVAELVRLASEPLTPGE